MTRTIQPVQWIRNLGLGAALMAVAPIIEAQAVPASVQACAARADNAERLACYDREVARLTAGQSPQVAASPKVAANTASSAEPATARTAAERSTATGSPAAAAPVTALTPEEQFGLSGALANQKRQERGEVRLKSLSAQLTNLAERSSGMAVYTLSNGQVWEQTEAGPDLRVKTGDTVTLTPGLLGSFWLTGPSSRVSLRVKRTR